MPSIAQQCGEHFSFWNDTTSDFPHTLLKNESTPALVLNYRNELGKEAAKVARSLAKNGEVLFFNASVGGSVIAFAENLGNASKITVHCADAEELNCAKSLIETNRLSWKQPLEGNISEDRVFTLSKDSLNKLAQYEVKFTPGITASSQKYELIIADFAAKDVSLGTLDALLLNLTDTGTLLLGTIDPVAQIQKMLAGKADQAEHAFKHATVGHASAETRSKNQFSITHLSAWRKLSGKEAVTTSKDTTKMFEHYKMSTDDYYENASILESYDKFHFGPGYLGIDNFQYAIAKVCMDYCTQFKVPFGIAMDAGCGPGRAPIEFAARFKQVEAFDYSQSFVDMMEAKLKAQGITNVTAYQGDAHDMSGKCTADRKFDLILGCNLIDRLHTPQKWVLDAKSMLTDKGILVVSSPYTWKDIHTPTDKWIGGFEKDGKAVYTKEGLEKLCGPELSLLADTRVPFVIPDPDGTYQFTYSNCTVFGKAK